MATIIARSVNLVETLGSGALDPHGKSEARVSERTDSGRCSIIMVTNPNEAKRNNAPRRPVVLLVEDETLLRDTTAEYLRLSGYTVIEAADAAEALAAFAEEPVDVVFSDVHLPGGSMDGWRLALWVHRHHQGVPVLLTSGHADAIHVAALVGESSFAAKPHRQKEVVSRLRRLLDEARGRAA